MVTSGVDLLHSRLVLSCEVVGATDEKCNVRELRSRRSDKVVWDMAREVLSRDTSYTCPGAKPIAHPIVKTKTNTILDAILIFPLALIRAKNLLLIRYDVIQSLSSDVESVI